MTPFLLSLALLCTPARVPLPQASTPRSLFSAPLYFGDAPPECRTLELLRIALEPAAGESEAALRERRLAEARALLERIAAGEPFAALVRLHSEAPNAALGGVLGTFAPGVLEPELDAFLFEAELGEVSAPLVRDDAVLLLRRGERWAGCREIRIRGTDARARGRAEEALARLAAGEEFAAVAHALSDDAKSRARGGLYRVFERGPEDRLLKRAVFEAELDRVFGPFETPFGLHVVERIAPERLPQALWESSWIRARALLVSHKEAPGPVELNARSVRAAQELAQELARRVRAEGADLAALAAEYDDDLDGRARAGDLGWLRRRHPGLQSVLERLFLAQPGELIGPLPLPLGQLLLRREDV